MKWKMKPDQNAINTNTWKTCTAIPQKNVGQKPGKIFE
jgi:hypothetical protein